MRCPKCKNVININYKDYDLKTGLCVKCCLESKRKENTQESICIIVDEGLLNIPNPLEESKYGPSALSRYNEELSNALNKIIELQTDNEKLRDFIENHRSHESDCSDCERNEEGFDGCDETMFNCICGGK